MEVEKGKLRYGDLVLPYTRASYHSRGGWVNDGASKLNIEVSFVGKTFSLEERLALSEMGKILYGVLGHPVKTTSLCFVVTGGAYSSLWGFWAESLSETQAANEEIRQLAGRTDG